jgi:hypothetical protein
VRFSFEVSGTNEVLGVLNTLDRAGVVRVQEALRAHGKELRREARGRVRRDTGAFRKKIRTKFSRDKLTATTAAFTRAGKPHPLSHILEFGTAPHSLAPKNGQALKMGEDAFAASVQHPGTPASPWLFPAAEATRGQLISAVRDSMLEATRDAARGHVPTPPSDADDDS